MASKMKITADSEFKIIPVGRRHMVFCSGRLWGGYSTPGRAAAAIRTAKAKASA